MLIDNNGEYNFWTTEVLTINYWVRCSADLLPPSPPGEKAGILLPFAVSFYRFEFMPIAAGRGT